MPKIYTDNISAGIKPDPDISYLEWANKKFHLAKESSAEYGRYKSSRTPFVEEPLIELSPQSPTQIVIVIKPTQCGGTTLALIFITGSIDLYPAPMKFFQPTDSMVKGFSKKKLTPTINLIPSIKDKIKDPKSRDSGNTILQKDYPGGSLSMSGSNSGASYRSDSVKYMIIDDFDEFEIDIDGQGSSDELADRRTGTFPDRKIYINSTTTIKGFSNIERVYDSSSQGEYNIRCPHCGALQYPVWGGKDAEHGIKFKRDAYGTVIKAQYMCFECKKMIDESKKPWILENGLYVHKFPERKARGFRWNGLHTPLGWINSWSYIAQKFLEATKNLSHGNPAPYKVWLNSFMSESYEEKGDRPEWTKLKARCEPYQPMTFPDFVRVLTAGVDVQHNRLAVSIYGWGAGEEAALIFHTEIIGDPQHAEVWKQLDGLLQRPFFDSSSKIQRRVISAGIDSGDGATTQAVRNYCRKRGPIVFALKGASTPGKPIISPPTKQDVTWKGEKIEGGVEMWMIGTDTAKSTLYARLKIDEHGPGCIHFYIGTSDEFFEQLTAEKLITKFVKGYPVMQWHNVRGNKRNEALDCFVYAYAAAIRAGISFVKFDDGKKKQKIVKKHPGKLKEKQGISKKFERPSWLER